MTVTHIRPPADGADPGMLLPWADAPYPVLVTGPDGCIRAANGPARSLFPAAGAGTEAAAALPAWMLARPTSGSTLLRGEHRDRSLEVHRTVAPDGGVVWWCVDDTDRILAQQALRDEQQRTTFLAEASSELLSTLNVDRCMATATQLAALHLADAAVLVAPGLRRRHPVTSCVADGDPRHATLRIDPAEVPGLAEALQGFPPVPSRWIDPATLPEWAIPEEFTGPVGSVVVTPLPGQGVPAGALILIRRDGHAAFDDAEEVFARLFSARAGAAIAAARLYAEQTAITATLMQDLLPPRLHQVHGVEFAGGYRAAQDADRIGGDFYDVHPGTRPDQESLVILGDVCGKGLDAAVLTGKIRNTLHALLPLAEDHQRVLELLNSALLTTAHTRFATLVLASAVRNGPEVRLRVTSAGHPAPLVVRRSGQVEAVETSGSLVGVLPDVRSTTAEVVLQPGETCLLYTDGITEARGGPLGDTLFLETRLRAALEGCAGLPAEAVVERVQVRAADWVGSGPHDDMAVVAVTAPAASLLSAVDGHTRGRYAS